jgi:hypothetical protein
MDSPIITRRAALATLGATAAVGAAPRLSLAVAAALPCLATPAQIAAVRFLLDLI